MCLLELKESGELSLMKDLINNIPPYAILLHTWGEDKEVTFQDLKGGSKTTKTRYKKIWFSKEQADCDRLRYF